MNIVADIGILTNKLATSVPSFAEIQVRSETAFNFASSASSAAFCCSAKASSDHQTKPRANKLESQRFCFQHVGIRLLLGLFGLLEEPFLLCARLEPVLGRRRLLGYSVSFSI